MIAMVLTDPEAPKKSRHSQILVPMDTPGIDILGPMCVFGEDHAPRGHMHIRFTNVRVPTCISLPTDATQETGWTMLSESLEQREGKLDVLINNAGAAWGQPLDEYPESGWDKVYDINVRGVFFLTQRLLPLLRKSAHPPARIINIASINGINPPAIETYAYSSSKAANIMLTRHLAKRLASENILVNAIAPGPFRTAMMAGTLDKLGDKYVAENPLKRLGETSDIAGTAIFMAAKASAYMTGAVIPCDGGVSQV